MSLTNRDAPQPGRGFAMVPAWLVWKQPTANALTVYVHLALFGTFNPGTATYEECRPSKKTLAHGDPKKGYPGTGLSESTVGRALRELEKLRAIKGEPSFDPITGAQGPTVYRLVFGQLVEEVAAEDPMSPVTPPPPVTGDMGGHVTGDTPSHATGDRGPRVSGGTPPMSPVTHNQEPFTKNPSTQSSDHPSGDRPGGGATRKASTRKRQTSKAVQPTLSGEEPATEERQPALHDIAMGIARGWIAYRASQNVPVVAKNALHALKSLVLPCLEAGYREDEIKRALNGLGEGIPSKAQMERALVRIRGKAPQPQRGTNGRPPAGTLHVNDAWGDDVRPVATATAGGGW
ncbi:hypothetical protein ACQSSU_20820 [Micromonospora echinospora]